MSSTIIVSVTVDVDEAAFLLLANLFLRVGAFHIGLLELASLIYII